MHLLSITVFSLFWASSFWLPYLGKFIIVQLHWWTMAADLTTDVTNLVKKHNSKSVIWNYFRIKADDIWRPMDGYEKKEHAANKYLVKMQTPSTCLLTFGMYTLYYIKKPWRPRKQAQGLHLAHAGIVSNLLYKVLLSMASIIIQKVCRLNNSTMLSHTCSAVNRNRVTEQLTEQLTGYL